MAPGPEFGEQQARFLTQVSAGLNRVRETGLPLRDGLRSLVPQFADLLVVVIQAPEEGHRIEVVHPDSNQEPALEGKLVPLIPAFRRLASTDLRNGRQFRWLPHLTSPATRILIREPGVARLLQELAVSSLMVVPLRIGTGFLGALGFARVRPEPFRAMDLATAQIIARRVSGAIERSLLYEATEDERNRRTRLETALEKWTRVFDLAGWGAAIVNGVDRRIDAANPAFARLHGYENASSLVGWLYSDLLAPDQPSETGPTGDWVTDSNRPSVAYEEHHVRADGTVFPVLTDITQLEPGVAATAFVVTNQDLTDLKRTEERLRRAQRLESVGRLAGGVAHEVNNMMTIILGFSDLLARSGTVPPERQRDIEEIRKAATRAGNTTKQLLAFSRQQILQPTDLDLNDVINELLPSLRLLLPANILLETSLLTEGAVVHADRAQVEQVLINLAFNARDAMPGGGTVRLVTESRQLDAETGRRLIGIPIPTGEYTAVSVVDTGYGMEPATLTQVFEPFFTTKAAGSGTGLGLATVYGIVKQSGGYVWVESIPEQGTTVTVCLPQHEKLPPSIQPEEAADNGRRLECRAGTVLVVEDEDGVRDLARRVLEQQGHRVLEARDGPEALESLRRWSEELDLVLSDVIVPDIATGELEQDVKRRRCDLPILYMSGYSREEMMERGLVPGGRAFLQKPFTAEELGNQVCRQLQEAEPPTGG